MMKFSICTSRLPILSLVLGLALAGCAGDPATVVDPGLGGTRVGRPLCDVRGNLQTLDPGWRLVSGGGVSG